MMHKIFIIAVFVVMFGVVAFAVWQSNTMNRSTESATITPTLFHSTMDRARKLMNTSPYSSTFESIPVFYALSENVTLSEGYSAGGKATFAIYELQKPATTEVISSICDHFKQNIGLDTTTVCVTNGNVVFLGYAEEKHKDILNNIAQAFAGEE